MGVSRFKQAVGARERLAGSQGHTGDLRAQRSSRQTQLIPMLPLSADTGREGNSLLRAWL